MGETIHNMRRRGDQPSAADFLQVSSDEQLPADQKLNERIVEGGSGAQ
jgi:hypothetical protein